jgi:hypothetical protein
MKKIIESKKEISPTENLYRIHIFLNKVGNNKAERKRIIYTPL